MKRPDMGDIWGGLGGMLVALPQSIAFGIVVFSAVDPTFVALGAVSGFLGATAVGVLAPLFGGTPRLISSPCAPAAAFLGGLVTEQWVRSLASVSPASVLLIIALVGFSAGLFQIFFSLLGGGRVIKYIPYPVVAGYMSSVGLIIIIGQLPRLVGGSPNASTMDTVRNVLSWDWNSAVIGLVTAGAMVVSPRITRKVPAAILGLLGGIVCYWVFAVFNSAYTSLQGNTLLIGRLESNVSFDALVARFHGVSNLDFNAFKETIIAGATLAVILSIDTLKSCVIVDTLTQQRSNSNRELLGQGIGNVASAFVGGIAGAGTLGATLVNISSGGVTRLSGVLCGLFSLAALFALSPLISWVPVPALAGILIFVGIRMIDWQLFFLVTRRATIIDFLVIVTVIVVALKYSLMAAAGAGFGLSAVFFLSEQMRGSVIRRKTHGGDISSKKSRLPKERAVLVEQGKRTAVYELQGSLFFGNTDSLFSAVTKDLQTADFLVLGMRRVQSMDSTAIHMFEQLDAILRKKNGRLILTDLPQAIAGGRSLDEYLKEVGIARPERHILVFEELHDGLEWVEDFILDEHRMYQTGRAPAASISEIEIFQQMSPDRIQAILPCLEEKSFKAGDLIFRAGDFGDQVFFIRRGSVKILLPMVDNKMMHLASFGRCDFFGDMSFVDNEKRSADARAETDTDLYALSRSRFEGLAARDPELGREFYASMVRALALRFRSAHNELRALE